MIEDNIPDDIDYIICPYCSRKLLKLGSTHIKTHGKTIDDLKREYPESKLVSPLIQEKLKKVNLEKYGVENPFQSNVIKEKIKQTNLVRYGVEFTGQAESVKEKIKQTNLERYGETTTLKVESVKEKIKKTCQEKYNSNSSMGDPTIREKAQKTFIKNYGVDNPGKSPIIKEKIVNIFKSKYGVDSPNKIQVVKDKKTETYLKRYGVDHSLKSKEVRSKIINTKEKKFVNEMSTVLEYLDLELIDGPYNGSKVKHIWKCKKCNETFVQIWNFIQQGDVCPTCNPRVIGISKAEVEIQEFISNYYNILKNNRKIIPPFELDIVIPDLKIAIEFCGIYWHSEKYMGKIYHLNKLEKCNKHNYRLITIFEDEWIHKKDLVKLKLLHILKKSSSTRIHARKCEIREIPHDIKNKFLDMYHIQGADKCNISLGAFYDNFLVAVMTFSKGSIAKGSKAKNEIWELNRFAVNSQYVVNGIGGKLLSFFKKNYNWIEIFSYADRRWSDGNIYFKLGFELDHITPPNYWYVKGIQRIHRYNLRKKKTDPKDIPEWVLRQSEGYGRIYDCGHIKFIMKK